MTARTLRGAGLCMGKWAGMTAGIARTYFDQVVRIHDEVVTAQGPALEAASQAVAAALAADRLIYVTGSGHSHLIAAEAFFRAGGVAAVQPIFDPALMLHVSASASSQNERQPGHAERILAKYPLRDGDVLIVASNSGRNAYPVEAALAAQQKGVTVIAITSLRHSTAVASRHASGKRLFEVADVVIDNGATHGDACLRIGPEQLSMGPTSTISGAFIVNAVLAQAVAILAKRGVSVDVYQSANGQGGDASVDAVLERWKPRILGL